MYAIGTGHSDFSTDKALVVCKVPCSSQKRAHISERKAPDSCGSGPAAFWIENRGTNKK